MDSGEGSQATPASSSDLYQSSESDQDTRHFRAAGNTHAIASKRKLENALSSPDKRRRLSCLQPPTSLQSPSRPPPSPLRACKGLPPEIWLSIFLHLSPHDLGRLLQVNRAFLLYLTRIVTLPEGYPRSGVSRLQTSESVWAKARKTFNPGFPRPMRGFTERQMWALVGRHGTRRTCQFCQKSGDALHGNGPWEQGPGADGVRIIWPFGVRSCGKCLEQKCQRDVQILLSPAYALLPGLPYVLLTQDLHILFPSALHQLPSVPPNVQLLKYYYPPQVEEIEKEFAEARGLGSSAAEEWLKGLDARREGRLADAERCDRWDARSLAQQPPPSAAPAIHSTMHFLPHHPSYPSPTPSCTHPPTIPLPSFSTAPTQSYSPRGVPLHPALPPVPNPPQSPFGPSKTMRDVNVLKTARKAEIERRAQALNPPIPAKLLRHMESFKAAIQIASPLTDQAWDMLVPRLIAQRESAEEIESQQATQMSVLQAKSGRPQDASSKEVKEMQDREWDDLQRPIRDRLSRFADEIIREQWRGGDLVNKDNAAKFAAAVLIHVRRRYYSEVIEADKDSADADDDSSSTGFGRKLVLENMKWVFDNKIKHITERYRKDLFLCGRCDGNFKFYGFEGVTQHYGAKHTNLFSCGNAVVAWKEAEWPEEPPFHPDPLSVRNALASSASMAGPPYQLGTYSRGATATPGTQHGPFPVPQFSPIPNHFMGPFAPPSYPPGMLMPGYDPQVMHQGALGPAAQAMGFQGSPANAHATPAQGIAYPVTLPESNPSKPSDPPAAPSGPKAKADRQGWGSPNKQSPKQRPASPLDKEQVSFFANAIRETWSSLSGIKDLSGSVRLYVTIKNANSSFHNRFGADPTLNILSDALSNHSNVKLVKNAHGFSCKACRAKPERERASSSGTEEMKMYSTMSLVFHFSQVHASEFSSSVSAVQGPLPDWREDMIDLPGPTAISDLVNSPGMDDKKLKLIADGFPHLFPSPLPRLDRTDELSVGSPAGKEEIIKSEPGTDSKGTPVHSEKETRPSSHGTETDPPHIFGEDEYDPRRPAIEYSRAYVRRQPAFIPISPERHDPTRILIEPEPLYYLARTRTYDEYGPSLRHPDYDELRDDRYIEVPARGPSAGLLSGRDVYHRYHEVDAFEYPEPRPREQVLAATQEPSEDRRPRSRQGRQSHSMSQQAADLEKPSSGSTAVQTSTEVERFLSSVLRSQDLEEYHQKAEEKERERESVWRAKWEAEKAADEKTPIDPPRPEPGESRADVGLTQGGALVPLGPPSAGRPVYGPVERQHSPGLRSVDYVPINGPARRPERPYHAPARYARLHKVFYHHADPSQHGHRIARSHSRFSRYDEQRRRLTSERRRSTSPSTPRRQSVAAEDTYGDRSIEHAGPSPGGRPSQLSPRDTVHYDESYPHSPDLGPVRYRYSDPPPPFDDYSRQVYVRYDPYGPPSGPPSVGQPVRGGGGVRYPPPSPRPRFIAAEPRHLHPAEAVPVYEPYDYSVYERYPPPLPPQREPKWPLYDDYYERTPLPRPHFEGGNGGRERRRVGGVGAAGPPQPPPPPPSAQDTEMGEGRVDD